MTDDERMRFDAAFQSMKAQSERDLREQRRYEIARDVMAAIVAGRSKYDEESTNGWNTIFVFHAARAVNAADALLSALERRDEE